MDHHQLAEPEAAVVVGLGLLGRNGESIFSSSPLPVPGDDEEGFRLNLTELNPSDPGGGGGVMQFLRGGGGGGGFGGTAWEVLRRHFSRKRAVNVRRINPKVPKEEAVAISERLLQILSDHGPLTVGNTWNHAKDAGIAGLNSKTHMKILLKWMTGRNIVKLNCVHVGNTKKFLYSPFTESGAEASSSKEAVPSSAESPEANKASAKGWRGKAARGQPKKQAAAALQ